MDEGFEAEKEVFDKVLDKFKKNNKRSYDFLTKASEEFQNSIFLLCKRIIKEENIPEKFRETTLHQIWKKKPGSRKEDLDANRYIHCKEYLPRTVEAIVVSEMEKSITEATSKFQIGGVAGHRPQEHLFCVKSIQARQEKMKKMMILYTNDAAKFFDKEVLVDCMEELYRADIDPKAYRMFFLLNQRTRIRVRTGCGYSSWEEAGDLLGQGSGGAAKVSALNLDRKLNYIFGDSKEMMKYGSIEQQPYSFQDDALVLVENIEALRVAVAKMELVMKTMQVKSNQSKCGYILMGPPHMVQEARKRLESHPLRVDEWRVQELSEVKWLGDQLSNGLSRAVMATIQARAGKLRRSSYEILNIVKDYRAQRIGGFYTAILLWESCAVPSLLYNCSTWIGIGRKEEEALAEIQDFHMRLILGSGPGAHKQSLRADFGVQSMQVRIWRQKLMLVHHLRSLSQEALASEMYEEQVRNNWPGLAREAEDICDQLGIENVNETRLSKSQYGQVVDAAIFYKEDEAMKRETSESTKMRVIRNERWGMKDYVKEGTLYSVRTTWEVRAFMLRVAGNYSHHTRYQATGWLCQGCRLQVREDQDHLAQCEGYEDLRLGKDLEDDKDLVTFYRMVMARREARGWD